MFQLTFSEQSLQELNSLNQSEQLQLMEKLSSLTSEILNGEDSSIGKFIRNGKTFYRLRIEDLRVYLEEVDISLHCQYILQKNSLNDFLVRCKMPSSEHAILENHQSFWEYLESLTKNK